MERRLAAILVADVVGYSRLTETDEERTLARLKALRKPDVGVTVAAAFAGVFWTYVYYRYRVLSPLAFSHALLGTTFSYWVYGRDLAEAWAAGL